MHQVWKSMMSYKRGEVVLVRCPNSDLKTYKKRPALVVQADGLKTGLRQRIVAMITSTLSRVGDTRVPVTRGSAEGQHMGLLTDSVVVTDNLATVLDREVDKTIGRCPNMHTALRRTLGL